MNEEAEIGIVGLAVMGENLALNIAGKGFPVAVFNRTASKTERFLGGRGRAYPIDGFFSLQDFVAALRRPRRVMMMLRAGSVVDEFIDRLAPLLEPGDIVIDGGNSHFADSARRLEALAARDIHYIGSGVSGGEEGALRGPSIMPGGSAAGWPAVEPIFSAIAARADDGEPCCGWMGPGGAGHFVKMVHNGIEYGDMQLICEAYHLMRTMLGLDSDAMQRIFSAWNDGALNSYLIEITADILGYRDEDGAPLVDKILDTAGQKGTGTWTVDAALARGVPLSLISESVFARCLSARKELREDAAQRLAGPQPSFAGDHDEMIAALGEALYAAKIISYAQGFSLLREASKHYEWSFDLGLIARIWRAGCIIRSGFLDRIAAAYRDEPDLEHLLFADYFQQTTAAAQSQLRRIVAAAAGHGLPAPCLAAALAYYDGLRSARLPANLLQAQRDYFGAHTYERVDAPRGKHFHTDWTGAGGDTTSTPYNS